VNIVQLFYRTKHWASQDNWKVLAISVLLIILVAGVVRDAQLLFRHDVAVGIDGYYYVLQIDSLKHNHRLYFSTRTPLVLYFLTFISYVENNSVAAIKTGGLLLHVLLSLGIFALILTTTRKPWLAVLGSGLITVSGLHLYMIAEYINALGALMFLVWSAYFVVRWTQTRRPMWIALFIISLTAAFFSHQLAVGITSIAAISLLLFRGLISFRFNGKMAVAALIAIVVSYFAPALVKAQAVVDIPDRLRTELTAIPQWPLSQASLPETLMLALLVPLTLILLLGPNRVRASSAAGTIVGLVAIWSLLVTLNPFLNQANGWTGIVGRIRGLAYIQLAVILPGAIWLMLPTWRTFATYLLAAVPPFAILTTLSPLPLGLRDEGLLRRERLVQQFPYHKGEIPDDSFVIASHGDQFLVSSTLGIASQRLPPPSDAHPNVYWLLDGPKEQLSKLESFSMAEHPTSRTILVEQGTLAAYLLSATDTERRALLNYNRHLLIAYNRGGPGSPFRSR
jgi:hypothetical protein